MSSRAKLSILFACACALAFAACQGQAPAPPPAAEPAPAVAAPAEPAPAAPAPAEAVPAPQTPPAAKPAPSKPAPARPAEAARPAEPAKPKFVALTIPAGTVIQIEIREPLSSKTAAQGQTFQATVTQPVVVDGREAIPAGTALQGHVAEVKSAAHWDKGGMLTLKFDQITLPGGEAVAVDEMFSAEGKSGSTGKRAGIIAGSAAGGAILGKVLGKDNKDAAIGAVVGGAIGTGVAAGQKGDEVELPAASPLTIQISHPIEVKLPA